MVYDTLQAMMNARLKSAKVFGSAMRTCIYQDDSNNISPMCEFLVSLKFTVASFGLVYPKEGKGIELQIGCKRKVL